MPKNNESTMKWKVDIADLQKSMKEAKNAIALANAEFKESTAGLKKWQQTSEGVEAKLKQLKTTLTNQQSVLDSLNKKYEITARELGADSDEAQKLLVQIKNQEAAVKKTSAEIDGYNADLDRLQKEEAESNTELGKLTRSIEDQEKQLESLQKEYKNAVLTYGENSKQAKKLAGQIEELSGELNDNKQRMNAAEYAADDLGEELDSTAKSAKNADDGFTVMKGALANLVASGISAAISAFKDLAKSMKEALVDAAAFADDINTQAKVTGISTDKLQEYAYMANLVDVSVDTLTGSMTKLTKNMASAQSGSKTATEAFKKLGVSITDNKGNLRDNEDVFNDIIDKLGKMTNETERDALAMSVFGKSAQDLNPLIMAGSEELAKLTKEAHEMGAVMDTETLGTLNDLQDTMDRFSQASEAAKRNIAANFAPIANEILTPLTGAFAALPEAIQTGDFSKVTEKFGEIGNTIKGLLEKAIPKIVGAVVSIRKAIRQKIIEMIPKIPGLIKELLGKVKEKAPEFIQSGTESIKSFIQGITSTIPQLVAEIPGLIQAFSDTIMTLLPELVQSGVEILNALIDGVVSMIPQLAESLPQIIDTIVTVITDNLPAILDAGVTILMALVDAIPKVIEPLAKALPTIISKIVDTLSENLPKILEAGIDLFMKLVDAIPKVITELVDELPTIITSITSTLTENLPKILSTGMKLFRQILKAIPKFLVELGTELPSIISKIVNGLLEGIAQIADVGRQLVEGLWNGIKNAGEWIKNKVKGFGEGIVNGLKDFFGINSPSKLFEDEIGKNLALGIGEGFRDEMRTVSRQMQQSVGGLNDALNGSLSISADGLTSAASAKTQTLNFTQVINSPTPVDRLTIYRETNSLLFNAKVGMAT